VEKGDVVLIREDGCPRMAWPMGLITETYEGSDGLIRACKIKTKSGEYTRSIQRLHSLELHAVDQNLDQTEQTEQTIPLDENPAVDQPDPDEPVPDTTSPVSSDSGAPVRQSRFGRRLKPISKLDL